MPATAELVKYGRTAGKGLWHTVDKLGWSKCGVKLTGDPTTNEPPPGRHCMRCWASEQKESKEQHVGQNAH